MMRKFVLALCFLLIHAVLAADAFAIAPAPALSKKAVKVADAIARLGAGEDALVAARLRDASVVKGRVTSIARYSFVVNDAESGAEQRVFYSAVDRLKGVNLASGNEVQVGLGIRAKLARVAGFLLPTHRVQKNSMTGGEKTLLIGIAVGVLLAIVLAKAL